jgi:hypothetical protein
MENVPLEMGREIYFYPDGVPPRCGRLFKAYLNQRYEDRWIGSHLGRRGLRA